MSKIIVQIAIAAITTLSSVQASANLDELLETEVGIWTPLMSCAGALRPMKFGLG